MTPFEAQEFIRITTLMLTSIQESIHAKPNAVRPDVPYASVNLNTMEQVGYGEISDEDLPVTDIKRKYSSLFNITFSVNFYKTNAILNCGLFSGGLINNNIVYLWNIYKIGLVSRSPVRDLSLVFNASFEERAQVDIVIQALISDTEETILSAEVFKIMGEIENSSGKISDVDIQISV